MGRSPQSPSRFICNLIFSARLELFTRNYELLEQGTFFARLAFFLVTLATLGLLAHLQPPESPCVLRYLCMYRALYIVLIIATILKVNFKMGDNRLMLEDCQLIF
jgi:hypothetical protein